MVGFTQFNGGGRGRGIRLIEQPFDWLLESGTAEPVPDLKEDGPSAAGVPARKGGLVLDLRRRGGRFPEVLAKKLDIFRENAGFHPETCTFSIVAFRKKKQESENYYLRFFETVLSY